MRLFVALNLPDEQKERLHDAAAPLRDAGWSVRWVGPESIHLTLKFLGEVRPSNVEQVEEAIANVAAKTEPFDVGVGQLGAFPSVRRPRVVWVGVDATPELRCLKHDLEWELASLGFDRETRAYHPHLTLGRVQKDARAGDFRDFEDYVRSFDFETVLEARTVDLMRSHLSPKGARYELLTATKLGEPAEETAGEVAS